MAMVVPMMGQPWWLVTEPFCPMHLNWFCRSNSQLT